MAISATQITDARIALFIEKALEHSSQWLGRFSPLPMRFRSIDGVPFRMSITGKYWYAWLDVTPPMGTLFKVVDHEMGYWRNQEESARQMMSLIGNLKTEVYAYYNSNLWC